MPSFTFTDTIPATNNSPSSDQPKMLVNNQSTKSIIGVDHYTFGSLGNQDGWHKQVTLPVPSPFVMPLSLAGQAVLYSNTAVESQLFATNDAKGHAYQLTAFRDGQFATFGQNIQNYVASGGGNAGNNFFAGWSFLPGGLLYQYGEFNNGIGPLPGKVTIPFPVKFTNANTIFNILLTFISTSGKVVTAHTIVVDYDLISEFQFQARLDGTPAANPPSANSFIGFYWTAIGL